MEDFSLIYFGGNLLHKRNVPLFHLWDIFGYKRLCSRIQTNTLLDNYFYAVNTRLTTKWQMAKLF